MMSDFLSIKELFYSYPSGEVALRGINLQISCGETVGVVGGNGAGKTTLLMHLNGCLLAASGTVSVGGLLVSKQNLKEIRNQVGLLFKDPDDQLFMPTVEEDVAFGLLNMGLSADVVEQRVVQALDSVDALHLRKKSPVRLSAGEKRRAALAAVLSMKPSVLVLDEPTDGLDPYARRKLINVLQGVDHTLVIASHDLDFVAATCRRVLLLNNGCLMSDSSPEQLFINYQLLAECHLEPPLSLQSCAVCTPHKY